MIGEQIFIPRPGGKKPTRKLFVKPAYGVHLKPGGGLWTSTHATSADEGWEGWCRTEMPHWLSETGYLLTPKPDANVITVDRDTVAGFVARYGRPRYPDLRGPLAHDLDIDWEKIVTDGYDGVRVTDPFHPDIRYGTVLAFYAWDCESTWWARWVFEETAGRPVPIAAAPINNCYT